MKSILNAVLLIAILFTVSGCSDNPASSGDDSLVGTWSWTKGVSFGTETPETCGCTRTLIFYKNGTFVFYYNGKIADNGRYSIRKEYNKALDQTFTFLDLNDYRRDFEFVNDNEFTVINSICLSCPMDYYQRESSASLDSR